MAAFTETRPHAVVVPLPVQGHINPHLKLAKLLHARGFHITFVNSEYNHRRLTLSRGPDWATAGLDGFRFETIPDGLPPPSDENITQDVPALCASTRATCLAPFRDLMARLSRAADVPPVTCIVSDAAMGFTVDEDFGVPVLLFFAPSACGCWSYFHFGELVRRGYTPLKDESFLTNGYLDTPIDWIVGLENIRLRDLPSLIRTTDPDDVMLNIMVRRAAHDAPHAAGIILNTFDDLEGPVLFAIRSKFPNLYAVGPVSSIAATAFTSISGNLWKEDTECIKWLDDQADGSVLYVNFGSITVVTAEQLLEFAWGLARSGYPFLWVVRPDMVRGEAAVLPAEFAAEVEGRGLLVGWCNQEEVLAHPATAVFLSHCGWNSTLESISEGVPMICWPFFADQQTNCRYLCTKWGMGTEISSNARKGEVEGCIREVMTGDKGREMRKRALEWKERASKAIGPGGSSSVNLERLVADLIRGR
ncbi:UDP-Glycosyltransferase [Musa troglodytarum]|uniref:Glycosyltransferase n=1 Tax=Musa troglodytarum TaxID=320322 RepID=A0A9E7HI43_9LILI|nr:UDP-Glycosyltransferase [Musa troglodytarum]